jgi:hypothetical protein
MALTTRRKVQDYVRLLILLCAYVSIYDYGHNAQNEYVTFWSGVYHMWKSVVV